MSTLTGDMTTPAVEVILPERRYTPEDHQALPERDRFELVDGRLVERNMGSESSWLGGQMYLFLGMHNRQNRVGWVFPSDAAYQCFPEAPQKIRYPDASFIQLARLASPPTGYLTIAADLMVEVVSPNDLYSEVVIKVGEYLRAGVKLVWVIDPPTRSVRVYRADGTTAELFAADTLDGADVVPGFRLAVAELFRQPQADVP